MANIVLAVDMIKEEGNQWRAFLQQQYTNYYEIFAATRMEADQLLVPNDWEGNWVQGLAE